MANEKITITFNTKSYKIWHKVLLIILNTTRNKAILSILSMIPVGYFMVNDEKKKNYLKIDFNELLNGFAD
jgi:hypothetical protein